jgi:hypothetical protein
LTTKKKTHELEIHCVAIVLGASRLEVDSGFAALNGYPAKSSINCSMMSSGSHSDVGKGELWDFC